MTEPTNIYKNLTYQTQDLTPMERLVDSTAILNKMGREDLTDMSEMKAWLQQFKERNPNFTDAVDVILKDIDDIYKETICHLEE